MDGECFVNLKLSILVAKVWVRNVIVHPVASFLKVEEDLQGSSQTKEETDGTELKQEPMEIEEKKPEVKVDVKEEEESGTNGTASQSTSPSQPRKKSTWIKRELLLCALLSLHFCLLHSLCFPRSQLLPGYVPVCGALGDQFSKFESRVPFNTG